MRHTLVQLLKQILYTSVQPLSLGEVRRRHNLPAAPRRVDFTHAANFARVVVLLGREVLPHEEVCVARVDGVAQPLKCVEDDVVGIGLRAWGGQPAVLIGEDVAHHVATGADARDANLAALEGVDGSDFRAFGAG